MKHIALFALLASFANAAITGTVVNGTTGKPQAGVAINLVQPTQQGMEQLGTATSGADGTFSFAATPAATAPVLFQATHQTVVYTTMLQPNQPQTNVQVLIYDSSASREGVSVDRHGILLEPTDKNLMIREFIFLTNKTKTTYADAANGTYRFFVPKDAAQITVTITPPSSMAVTRPAEKTSDPKYRKIDFPIRPGQTQIELQWAMPLTDPLTYTGEILHNDGETRLIVPKGLALEGEGLESFAPEPRTQSPIYGVKPGVFTVKVTGKAAPVEPEDPDSGSPDTRAHRPRIYDRYWWIMGFGLAIMAVSLFAMASRSVPVPAKPVAAIKPAKKK